MTLLWQTVLQGAVGFAIGAGTNDLAIRWLFATVFTKKKKAIAESVQKVVSSELMSSDKIVARLADPSVRAAFERHIREDIDDVLKKVTVVLGGVTSGLRPFMPSLMRTELDAFKQAGSAVDDDVRSALAKVCASQTSSYLSRNIPRLVEETRFWGIIYDSIMSLDEAEMEMLTRQVANKELRGITLLGGVIGAIVGVTMSFVIYLIG